MKKVISVVLALMMVLSMSISAFAATNAFIESPSGNPAPKLENVDHGDPDCDANVIITPYVDRDQLRDKIREVIEEAYESIKNNEEDSSLDKAFDKLDSDDDLAISDLFNLDYTDCDAHDKHQPVTITVSAETLDHFVGLLVYVDGEWKVVEGAKIDKAATTLIFTASEFGPYAIVVDSAFSGNSPSTGDPGINWIWFALLAVSGLGLITVGVISKKSVGK